MAQYRKVKIGLVGCGRWGRNILRDLLLLDCEVYVAEHKLENREKAQELGAVHTCYELDELPEELDGYIVAVHTVNHYEVLKQLSLTRKPVFVEKPASPVREHVVELTELMGDRLFVMHKWRYHPAIQKIAEIRESGVYGNVKYMQTARLQWGQPHDDVDAFWILAPHDVSIVYHVLGYLPEVRDAQACVFDSSVHSMTAFLGGAHEPKVQIQVSDHHPATVRNINVHFEKAVVSLLNPTDDYIEVRQVESGGGLGQEVSHISVSAEFPLIREIRQFVEYILGHHSSMVTTMEEELMMMDVLNKMRQIALAISCGSE